MKAALGNKDSFIPNLDMTQILILVRLLLFNVLAF